MKPEKVLNVEESLRFIKKYKIPVVEFGLAKRAEDAIELAEKIGYPVALKIVSSQPIHKTEAKGIALDIRDEKELEKAYGQLIANVKRSSPSAKIRGVLVQRMIKKGYETIVGGLRDGQFGPTVMVGLGGIFVEVFDDAGFRVAPFSKRDALEMIREIKGYKILRGYRNSPPADIDSLAGVIVRVGKIMSKEDRIKEIDINPLFVLTKGAVAVDARIVLGD